MATKTKNFTDNSSPASTDIADAWVHVPEDVADDERPPMPSLADVGGVGGDEAVLLASVEHRPHEPKASSREGIWTLQMMEEAEPLPAVAVIHGREFKFTFKPILNDLAIQRRFRLHKKFTGNTNMDTYYELSKGYAEVLEMVVVTWDLQEEMTDEDGEPLMEVDPDQEPDPDTGEQPLRVKLRALPVKLKYIERLSPEVCVAMFLGMQQAMNVGEVNSKP